MGKYLKKFQTTSQYNAYTADTAHFIKPNVSLITETNTVEYNPYVPETMVVAKYNVTSTSNPTPIGYNQYTSGFSAIEIDGITQPSVVSAYTFSTTGEHTVKYTLTDPASIGFAAFTNCTSLTSIEIPDSVTRIDNNAFASCSSLTSITIPSGITSFGNSVFTGCISLPVENNIRYADTYAIGVIDKAYTTYNIKSGTKWIGRDAFSNCSGMTSITIPNSVTRIGDYAFDKCSGLTSITIPDSVTSMGWYVFNGCSSLTSVTIGSGVTSIGEEVFYGCSGLTSIDIPSGVTSIGNAAFNGTPWWNTYSADTSHHYGNIIYINDVAYKATSASITSATFKSGTVSIGGGAFQNCSGLTSIDIPDGVTSIGKSAFQNCSGLTSIDIPSSVTSIGEKAFRYCTSLTSIASNATTAPTIYYTTFRDIKTSGTLTVPIGSSGYDVWMGTGSYYLGKYNWTKVEQ